MEVARRVKTTNGAAAPIVIHVSATHRADQDRLQGVLYGGADAYLFEPVDPDELVGTIRRLLIARTG
jgi:DNA-binding response OmpR family regulator